MAAIALQVFPWSSDQLSASTSCRVRQITCNLQSGYVRTLGWMASNSTPSLIGPTTSHVCPKSLLISKYTRQSWYSPSAFGYSMLVEIGSASCRERVCQSAMNPVVALASNKLVKTTLSELLN